MSKLSVWGQEIANAMGGRGGVYTRLFFYVLFICALLYIFFSKSIDSVVAIVDNSKKMQSETEFARKQASYRQARDLASRMQSQLDSDWMQIDRTLRMAKVLRPESGKVAVQSEVAAVLKDYIKRDIEPSRTRFTDPYPVYSQDLFTYDPFTGKIHTPAISTAWYEATLNSIKGSLSGGNVGIESHPDNSLTQGVFQRQSTSVATISDAGIGKMPDAKRGLFLLADNEASEIANKLSEHLISISAKLNKIQDDIRKVGDEIDTENFKYISDTAASQPVFWSAVAQRVLASILIVSLVVFLTKSLTNDILLLRRLSYIDAATQIGLSNKTSSAPIEDILVKILQEKPADHETNTMESPMDIFDKAVDKCLRIIKESKGA